MSSAIEQLIRAEEKALFLFEQIQAQNLIVAGKTELELNKDIFSLADHLLGIKKYWHKRIVRAGKNTLLPYAENPVNLELQEDDILFLDFGPVFDEWEADLGRTFVLGKDPRKTKLAKDVAVAWEEGKAFYDAHRTVLTGSDFYQYTKELAHKYGWQYGNEHCGHLIGNFPHERILGETEINYIHPDNHTLMSALGKHQQERFWIYEIHFIDETLGIGGFYEQLLRH